MPLKVFEWCPSRHAEQVSPQVRANARPEVGKEKFAVAKARALPHREGSQGHCVKAEKGEMTPNLGRRVQWSGMVRKAEKKHLEEEEEEGSQVAQLGGRHSGRSFFYLPPPGWVRGAGFRVRPH